MRHYISTVPSLSDATIEDLRHGLQSKEFSSLDLVETYLARILQINPLLNAVIEINPDAADLARISDEERINGKIHGPFHGIPFMVKDVFCTLDKMKTSAGCYALAKTRPSRESTVVTKLRDNGAILLGKTNLSEWANFRGPDIPDGWSSMGGQSYAPYSFQQEPTGSSSGSAIATATGLCAFTLGIETSGSIVEPAARCAVIGLKPTVGLTSRVGLIPGSEFQDTVGPLTRSVKDAAYVLDIIAGKDPLDKYTEAAPALSPSSYALACKTDGLSGIRVGVPWKIIRDSVEDTRILRDFEISLELMNKLGAVIVEDANFPAFESGWTQKNRLCSHATFRHVTELYLASLEYNPDQIRTLEDVVSYIEKHENSNYPKYSVDTFKKIIALPYTTDSVEYKDALKTRLYMGAEGGVLGALEEHNCDVLVLPTDSDNPTDIAGYPTINVPLGFGPADMLAEYSSPNVIDRGPNIPYGLLFAGRKWSESLLIQVAFAYEQASKTRDSVMLMIDSNIEINHTLAAKQAHSIHY